MSTECQYKENEITQTWQNKDNDAFYDNLNSEMHDLFSKKSDLDLCPDLYAAKDIISDSQHILEVGAGFGRVINNVLSFKPNVKITGIEKSQPLANYLKTHFEKKKQVQIINDDFLKTNLTQIKHVDCILLMWSTISTFNENEHFSCLKQAYNTLSPGGKIVIDSCYANRSMALSDGNYLAKFNDFNHFGFMMPLEHIASIGKKIGFRTFEVRKYITKNKVTRFLTIMEK